MNELLLESAAFFALFIVGVVNSRALAYTYIWTGPFLAGNLIFGFSVTYSPYRAAAFACVALALLRSGLLSTLQRFGRWSIATCAIAALLTGVGLILIELIREEVFLSTWSQAPSVRAVRAQLNDVLFFLIPAAMVVLLRTPVEAGKALRQFVFAGFFYVALGLLQFALSAAFGYDPFPITRGAAATQSVAAGLEGRINSICGEPRYFAAYCVMWFTILVAAPGMLRMKAALRYGGVAAVLGASILSGSRTAVGLSGLVVIAMVVFAILQARRGMFTKILLASVVVVAYAVAILVGGNALSARTLDTSQLDDTIEVFGFRVIAEHQDIALLRQLSRMPHGNIVGYGAGLWQYFYNPYEAASVRRIFRASGVMTMDSLRPNFGALAKYSSYGLVGMLALFLYYRALYAHFGLFAQTGAGDRRFLFYMFVSLSFITYVGDIYAHALLGAVMLAASRQICVQPRRPALEPSPVVYAVARRL